MPRRSLAALLGLAVLCLAGPAFSERLSEADVIRLAKNRDPEVSMARAEAGAARAREVEASLYPNPSLAWEREHLLSGSGSREDTFVVGLPIDVSGRRSTRASLARSEAHAASFRELRSRSQATLRALETFYAALAADARVDVEGRTVARLRELVRVLDRRRQEGTTSGYDVVRLELELELAEAELRRGQAEAEARRTELMLSLGLGELPKELGGSLVPPAQAVDRRSSPPSVELARESERDAAAAVSSAGSAWIPTVVVEGGLKIADETSTQYGYVAGVSLEVPLFSRAQELGAVARAEQRLAFERRRTAERTLHAAAIRARQRLNRAQEELARFDKATGDRLERLARATETGYREGTRSITELLDAERTRAEIELKKIELLAELKQAEVSLRASRGEFE